MELLRFLLQLGEAALGVDVDGILCDLALRMLLSAQADVCALAGRGALLELPLSRALVEDVRY